MWQYLFIETICSDPAVLEQNYRNKMRYSPDYTGVDTEQVGSSTKGENGVQNGY